MITSFPSVDFSLLMPSLIILVTTMVTMIVIPFLRERLQFVSGYLSLIGLAAALVALAGVIGKNESTLGAMFLADDFGSFFTGIFLVGSILTVLMSIDYLKRKELDHGEYYPLILFATYGMMVMASTGNLAVIFLGLEIMSVSLYVLAGFARTELRSTEASIKYFLLGAFATGFTVFGIAFIYGSTGSFELSTIATMYTSGAVFSSSFLLIGAALIIVGLGFKIAAVPFHMWAPDVYEGAPSPITGFMSAGPKAAAFAAMLRIFSYGFDAAHQNLETAFWILAVVTMTIGNIMAIRQNNIKRMLAFSSIAHAGYVLIALVTSGGEAASAAAFYLLCYAVTNLGAFMIISQMDASTADGERTTIDSYTGLAKRHPYLSVTLTLFLISLAGFPPTAGFMGKFVLFKAALVKGYYALVVIAVLNSLVSVYYYLRVVVKMFMFEPDREPQPIPIANSFLLAGLIFAVIAVFLLGLYPQRWFPFEELTTYSLNP